MSLENDIIQPAPEDAIIDIALQEDQEILESTATMEGIDILDDDYEDEILIPNDVDPAEVSMRVIPLPEDMDNTVAEVTFSEFDKFSANADKIELFNLQPYWPTPHDIAKFAVQLDTKRVALLFSWLMDSNGEPETDEEKLSKKAMQTYVHKHLDLIDDPEPAPKEASAS